ncbi:MAG: hypothetical protein LBU37_10325 [Tannerellaceae bacterium]|jgi:hypothetical protein|nr:hypothetical protein [Tannerellaceae bacterium]
MSKKTYSYKDVVELSTVIEIDGKRKRITFSGGQMFPFKVDAKFTTSDEEIQEAIEKKKAFKNKNIFISAKYEDPKEGEAESKISAEVLEGKLNKAGFAEYPEITKVQEAKDVLHRKYGVLLTELKNKEDVLAAASKKKVSFPNLA